MNSSKPSTLTVLGVGRDVEKSIGTSIEILSGLSKWFAIENWVVVLSDCSDGSFEAARNSLAQKTSRIFNLGALAEKLPDRVERIRFCRQFALEHLQQQQSHSDFFLVADLDGVLDKLQIGDLEKWLLREDWAALYPATFGPYYDVFALRTRDKILEGPASRVPRVDTLISRRLVNHIYGVAPIQRKLSDLDFDLEVDSAFGGLGLYRSSHALSGSYETGPVPGQCEHVDFNLSIQGKKIITPDLVLKGPEQHVRFSRTPIFQLLRFFLHPLTKLEG